MQSSLMHPPAGLRQQRASAAGSTSGRRSAVSRARVPQAAKSESAAAAAESSGQSERYMARGVSAAKEDVHAAIKKIDKGLFPKAFCKIVPDYVGGDEAYCNIMHADGAGTKSSLAYLYWRETGDLSVWKGISQDAIIMNIDDLLCVGATDNILLSSTIGRNKNLITAPVLAALINGTEEVCDMLRSNGVNIISTGGETADLGDLVRTVVCDSTVTCRMRRDEVISNDRIRPGDVIVGMASYGKATYETEYNGGMGSNGLTSARCVAVAGETQGTTTSATGNCLAARLPHAACSSLNACSRQPCHGRQAQPRPRPPALGCPQARCVQQGVRRQVP